ncbi:hypothetical protein NA57DRAFT_42611, partial [Rhizodiscina lignyota]
FTSVAEIIVGQNETKFLIHRELLSHYSTFFANALNGTFAEGISQAVTLREERLDLFEYFVYWLYTQRLEDIYKDGKPTYFILLELYSLADRLAIEKLRNDAIDKIAELAEKTNSVLTPSDTYILYEQIRDSSPLRRLVLDLFTFKKTDNLLANHPDEWHPTFLRELVVKLKRPGYPAMMRHELQPFKPANWTMSQACDVCKKLLKPQAAGSQCVAEKCSRVFCNSCVGRGGAVCFDWPTESLCKPWKKNMCYYHEHVDTVPC